MKKPPLPRLGPGEKLLLCLDYDGTLVPLRKRPELAVIPPQVKKLLAALAVLPRVNLAVISGRELSNIRQMVGVKGLIYAGTHGLEIRGPGKMVSTNRLSGKERQGLEHAWRTLREGTKTLPGTFVEKKKMALAAHYRNAPEGVPGKLGVLARTAAAQNGLYVKNGKKVFELLPGGMRDKGGAVCWIRDELTRRNGITPLAIYIGDDLTDEDAFRVLRGRDLPVIVSSRRKTSARFRLTGVAATVTYLTAILHTLSTPKPSGIGQ